MNMGIDGCRAGWFFISIDRGMCRNFGIFPRICELNAYSPAPERVMIDMPIGLVDKGTDERSCDLQARKLLGRKGSSIFPAPCRPALSEPDYASASAVNHRATGRKLSKQSFWIMKKIKDVDDFLAACPAFRRILHECHPELSFLALNGFRSLAHSKKTSPGREERLDILSPHLEDAEKIMTRAADAFPRKDLALDDILDAMVLAVTAETPEHGRVPEPPERDSRGLPMQIVYPRLPPDSLHGPV